MRMKKNLRFANHDDLRECLVTTIAHSGNRENRLYVHNSERVIDGIRHRGMVAEAVISDVKSKGTAIAHFVKALKSEGVYAREVDFLNGKLSGSFDKCCICVEVAEGYFYLQYANLTEVVIDKFDCGFEYSIKNMSTSIEPIESFVDITGAMNKDDTIKKDYFCIYLEGLLKSKGDSFTLNVFTNANDKKTIMLKYGIDDEFGCDDFVCIPDIALSGSTTYVCEVDKEFFRGLTVSAFYNVVEMLMSKMHQNSELRLSGGDVMYYSLACSTANKGDDCYFLYDFRTTDEDIAKLGEKVGCYSAVIVHYNKLNVSSFLSTSFNREINAVYLDTRTQRISITKYLCMSQLMYYTIRFQSDGENKKLLYVNDDFDKAVDFARCTERFLESSNMLYWFDSVRIDKE